MKKTVISAHQVQLFALSTCGWCRKASMFLEDHNIDHEVIAVDLLGDEEKRAAKEKLSQYNPRKSYPTIVIDEKHIITGFDEERLQELLEV